MSEIIQLKNPKTGENQYPITIADNIVGPDGSTFQGQIDNCVKVTEQVLDEPQRTQARANIGAASGVDVAQHTEQITALQSEVSEAVKYTKQTPTRDEKLQARENISAQEKLIDKLTIKTLNNVSLLGPGNIDTTGGGGEINWTSLISDIHPFYSGIQFFEGIGIVYRNRDTNIVIIDEVGNKRVTKIKQNLHKYFNEEGNKISFTIIDNKIYIGGSSPIKVYDFFTEELVASITVRIPNYNQSLFRYKNKLFVTAGNFGELLCDEIDTINYTSAPKATFPSVAFFGRETWQNGIFIYAGMMIYNTDTNEFYTNTSDYITQNEITNISQSKKWGYVQRGAKLIGVDILKFDERGMLIGIQGSASSTPSFNIHMNYLERQNNNYIKSGKGVGFFANLGHYGNEGHFIQTEYANYIYLDKFIYYIYPSGQIKLEKIYDTNQGK